MKKIFITIIVMVIGGMIFTLTQTGGRIEKWTRESLVDGTSTVVYRYYDHDRFVRETIELLG